jgi:uncharacterized protein YdbL (DUF1318 family)
MMSVRACAVALGVVALVIGACVPVTVNVNFPQEKIQGAADQIEDMVRSPENPKPATEQPKKPQSRLGETVLAALRPAEAEAQQSRNVRIMPEIRTRTPELMKAIESRRGRRQELDALKAKGCVGETNQWTVEPRQASDCPGTVASLVGAENADRNYILQTLLEQNSMPASDASRLREALANSVRERAKPGDWIQQPDGTWSKKAG